MKVAVFGTTGQVARALARRAGPEFEIMAFGRTEADFRDPDRLAALVKGIESDAIINAVAYTAVDKAEDEPDLAELVNVTSVGRLAEVAAERAIPFIHISTDYVFDGSGDHPRKPDEPTAPIGVYGKTKRDGEIAVLNAAGPAAILRTSWVFSADGSNFVKTMLRLAESRDTVRVVSDQIGGPTSAASIADATLRIASAMVEGQPGGIFHFSGAPDVSWADFAREIFRQASRPVDVHDIPTSEYPTPAERPLNSRLDCGTLYAEFGIERPDWKKDLGQVVKDLT